jgi:hypothetical protein
MYMTSQEKHQISALFRNPGDYRISKGGLTAMVNKIRGPPFAFASAGCSLAVGARMAKSP